MVRRAAIVLAGSNVSSGYDSLGVPRGCAQRVSTLVAFQALAARWPQASRKIIEEKANGSAVLSSLSSKVPGIVPVNPKESKYARASAVSPFIEAGNVRLPARDVALFDVEALLEEFSTFPSGAHDDQVDATSQALAALLLDAPNGAAAWLAWAKGKAEAAVADRKVRELEERTAAVARREAAVVATGGQAGALLEGLVLDPVAMRKLARDEAHRARTRGLSRQAFL